MYYVYKISVDESGAVYVGCTNNLRRRKDQHNGNARTGKSYFGRYLASIGKVLSTQDLKVIASFTDRAEALKVERDTVHALVKSDTTVLNDLYSDHCSKTWLSGPDNPSSKEFVVIDMSEHTAERVRSAGEWCKARPEVSYKTLVGTANRKPLVHKGRYLMRHAEEWDGLTDSEKNDLISGKWYSDTRAASESRRKSKLSHEYVVETPNGIEIVKNLDAYARDHGINPGNLHASRTTGKTAAGYKVIKKLA